MNESPFIWDLLRFLFLGILPLILSSAFFFRKSNSANKSDLLINASQCLLLGIILITLFAGIVRILNFPWYLIWILPATSFILLRRELKLKNIRNYFLASYQQFSKHRLILLVILFGVILQSQVIVRGGLRQGSSLIFPNMRDTFWNLSIAQEIWYQFPPMNPTIAGVPLKNNHFYYPLFIATLHTLTGIGFFRLYFVFAPLIVSFLFGLGLYAVSTIVFKKQTEQSLCIFLGYFTSNLAFVLPFFFGTQFDWRANSFFADQPLGLLINPYTVLGITIYLFGIKSLVDLVKTHETSPVKFILPVFLFGSLFGFKSFGGVIALISLTLTAFLVFAVTGLRQIFLVVIGATILFLPSFFLIADLKNSYLHPAPGWTVMQMLYSQDKLGLTEYAAKEQFYFATGNTLALLKLKLFAFLIYSTGNLGIRLTGVVYSFYQLFKKRLTKDRFVLWSFITISWLVSFTFPLFFNLGGNTHDIIQFTPYALVLLIIPTSVCLLSVYDRFKKRAKLTAFIFILFNIALAIPVSVKESVQQFHLSGFMLSDKEIEALTALREKTTRSDVVLTNQYKSSGIYVATVSQRKIYLADVSFTYQTMIDPTERLDILTEFFEDYDSKILPPTITYLYLNRTNKVQLDKLNSNPLFNLIFQNEVAVIYKINR